MKWSSVAVAVVLAVASVSAIGFAQDKPVAPAKPATVDYDTFMKEEKTRAKDLEMRTAALFSRDQMMQILTINGDYIKKG